ncbi:MAG: DUF1934 domain-containing protein [Clostridia bacterium]|nr:DUF1934 domain-containing protein [Clostridia bacterium]
MDKQYLIKTTGVRIENDNKERFEVVSRGSYTYDEDKQIISYIEHGGELDGCKTVITAQGDCVETLRTGGYTMQLIAEKGKRHNCCYDTPYGSMVLGVFCNRVKNRLDENGGELEFSYTLDVNSALLSENKVLISIKEAIN